MICNARKIRAVAGASLLEMLRRRDIYAALILALALLVPLTFVNFFGMEGIVRHLREATLLLIWIFSIIITVTCAARQIPGELERRTILPLLSKPIRRSDLVLGKYFGAFLASGGALLLFYVCYLLLTGLTSGIWFSVTLLQVVFLHLCFVGLLSSLVLAGSMVFASAANITICSLITVGMLLFGQRLPQVAAEAAAPMSWILRAVHWIFPHFEFFDGRIRLIHEWGAYELSLLGIVLLYTLVYSALLILASVVLFKRKRL